jgi:hypothetical protein
MNGTREKGVAESPAVATFVSAVVLPGGERVTIGE